VEPKRPKNKVNARVARWHIKKPKIPILGKFLRVLLWKMLVYFMVIWYIFPRFGMLYQEKSGNPGPRPRGQFLSKEFPNCTSETIKARSYLVEKIIFFIVETVYIAFIVSDVKFGNEPIKTKINRI
jgi:hypothetical protein